MSTKATSNPIERNYTVKIIGKKVYIFFVSASINLIQFHLRSRKEKKLRNLLQWNSAAHPFHEMNVAFNGAVRWQNLSAFRSRFEEVGREKSCLEFNVVLKFIR